MAFEAKQIIGWVVVLVLMAATFIGAIMYQHKRIENTFTYKGYNCWRYGTMPKNKALCIEGERSSAGWLCTLDMATGKITKTGNIEFWSY